MSRKLIKETIITYMGGKASAEARMTFEKWLTEGEACEEKSEALSDIWDELSLTSANAPEDPYAIISEAERIEDYGSSKALRKKTIWLYMVSAVAACFAVLAFLGWNRHEPSEMCLMSSENGKGKFELPDGSVVCLNRNSRLYYSGDFDGDIREVTLEGEGYFDVAKNVERPFVVRAGDMYIKVLGTRFTVSAYEAETVEAYLEEGSIWARVPKHDPVVLSSDQAVVYDAGENKFEIYTETASDHTAWIDARLEFVNKSLNDILDCLEHWYCVDISCNDERMASEIYLSMTIRQESVEEILSALSRIANLSYFIDSRGNVKVSFNR